ncbi:MAG: PXPV repeat protein [Burkholderiales bacterium]|nr:PXPV repeat protein [Burkholderiales bacterium]
MNLRRSPKFLVAAGLAAAALGAASVAQAHPDVYFSIGLQDGPAWVEPAPVYVQPQRLYVQPAPVYLRPPVFVSPREVFEQRGWRRHDAHDQWERERAWRRAEWLRHEQHDGRRDGDRGDDERGSYRGHRD